MTVKSDQRKIIYEGNGTTTQFAVPFYFINQSDIEVSVYDGTTTTPLVLNTDYTLTGAGVETGGTVTTAEPVASGSEIAILRNVPYKQEMDIPENDIFPSQNMERALDRLTMQTQQLAEQVARSVTVDVFSDADPSKLVDKIEVLYDIKDDVTTVAGISSEVSDVSANKANINAAVANESNINAAVANETNINAAVANATNINAAVANESNINTAVSNMAAIIDAPNQASAAAASATLAQDWAVKMDGQVASTDYSSKYYADQSATSANNSHVWAEGTDEQVQALGGVHSSKVWAEQSTNANIDLSNLSAAGETHFQAPLVSGTNIKTINNVSLLGSGDLTVVAISSAWRSGQAFYIKYSNGFIIQGGTLTAAQDSPVTFWTPFASMYNAQVTAFDGSSSYTGYIFVVNNRSLTGMHVQSGAGGVTAAYMPKTWLAYGW